jgi:hypothetical protein
VADGGKARQPLPIRGLNPVKDLPIHYNPDADPDIFQIEQEVFTKDDNEMNEEDDTTTLMDGLASTFVKMSPLQKVSPLISAIWMYGLMLRSYAPQ